jgi:hypothetical protein
MPLALWTLLLLLTLAFKILQQLTFHPVPPQLDAIRHVVIVTRRRQTTRPAGSCISRPAATLELMAHADMACHPGQTPLGCWVHGSVIGPCACAACKRRLSTGPCTLQHCSKTQNPFLAYPVYLASMVIMTWLTGRHACATLQGS